MEKLYKKLESYGQSDYYPFHMPGHKRNSDSVRGDFPFERDITEIEGFDNLHHPEDILLEAQKNVSKLYGTEESDAWGEAGIEDDSDYGIAVGNKIKIQLK